MATTTQPPTADTAKPPEQAPAPTKASKTEPEVHVVRASPSTRTRHPMITVYEHSLDGAPLKQMKDSEMHFTRVKRTSEDRLDHFENLGYQAYEDHPSSNRQFITYGIPAALHMARYKESMRKARGTSSSQAIESRNAREELTTNKAKYQRPVTMDEIVSTLPDRPAGGDDQ